MQSARLRNRQGRCTYVANKQAQQMPGPDAEASGERRDGAFIERPRIDQAQSPAYDRCGAKPGRRAGLCA